MKKLIAVFGPGGVADGDALYEAGRNLGAGLARKNFVVLTGGYGGVMEAASRGAREAGGSVVGVTAEVYRARGREVNPFVTKEITVKSANDRLMELIDLADAYVAIGNSTGTLVEVMTAWDYTIKRFLPAKPMILVGQTWLDFQRYVSSDAHFLERERIEFVAEVDAALQRLTDHFGIQHDLPELNVVQR
jgi:uncharacterized protein (TIGR00725 family)